MAEDLHMTSLESFWAGISFLLSAVLFQPVHTALSDIFGRKIILYECILFFVVGSAVVGSAKNAAALILGRTVQGLGGGGMEALCEVILTDITTLKERPLYIGLLGLMWAAGAILAPIVGGLFSQYVSWRWVAWINLPLMGVAMVLLPIFLTLKSDQSSTKSKLKRVDWYGIVLFMTGMTCFVLALAWGGQLFAWSAWQTLFPLIFGVILLFAFGIYERHPEEPMLSPRLFANRTSSIAFLGSFIHGIIIWCLVYYLVLYFEGAVQEAPFQAAIKAFPLAFTLTPFAIVCAVLIELTRRYMWEVWTGWLLSTVGVGTMILLNHDSSKGLYSVLQIAPGIGCGFLLSALAVPVQASMAVDDAGVAMGTLVFFRNVGSVVGVSLGSAIFTNKFTRELALISFPSDVEIPDSTDAIFFLTKIGDLRLSAELRDQMLQLYAVPIKYIWVAVTCLSFIGLVSSLFMKELTLERDELSRQALELQGSLANSSRDAQTEAPEP